MLKNNFIKRSKPVEVIYILGAGHCGSTLLNLCFDQHSSIIGVSEIITLNQKKPGWSGNKNILSESFWSRVDKLMYQNYGKKLSEVPFNLQIKMPLLNIAIERNKEALDSILKVSKKSIISDSSKNSKRLEALLSCPLFRVKVIYLVRDGRAIVNAYRRKYGSIQPGLYNLIKTDYSARKLMAKYGEHNWITIRYEDMVENLKDTLKKICEFSEISFENNMMKPETSKFKGIGGNRILKKPINKIILDDRWKKEMSTFVRSFTKLMVYRYNKRYKY